MLIMSQLYMHTYTHSVEKSHRSRKSKHGHISVLVFRKLPKQNIQTHKQTLHSGCFALRGKLLQQHRLPILTVNQCTQLSRNITNGVMGNQKSSSVKFTHSEKNVPSDLSSKFDEVFNFREGLSLIRPFLP